MTLDMTDARCALCFNPLSPGEHFIVVRTADPTDSRLVTPANRSGVIHLRHLQNVFRPEMIDVSVSDQMGRTIAPQVRVQVQL